MARTLAEKVWDAHVVREDPCGLTILYIDLHLLHEATSPQAFEELKKRGLGVRRPDRTLATVDHLIPTRDPERARTDPVLSPLVRALEDACQQYGIPLFGVDSPRRGIVHVIGPELGLSRPGITIVCGDSHTSTHGALGALAFGIGTTEIAHVLATQCLYQKRPGTYCVRFDGYLRRGVCSKDMILALIARIGIGGATGHVIEYTGQAVRSLGMEERMTICNMSIEAGARAGMIAPDEVTFQYLYGRPFAPRGRDWEEAVRRWKALTTDPEARFDRTISLDCSKLDPMVTYGTNPGMGVGIRERVPDPAREPDPSRRRDLAKALAYMDLRPGQPLLGQRVDFVFLGSCTNSRLSDLRLAAGLLRGRKVAPSVRMIVVPGSQQVKAQAEAEGLDRIFREAGAEWRDAGCSMCIAMNGDIIPEGAYCLSTSNRNFEGRQGKGARTFLASPLTAAATAIEGCIADPREFL